MIRFSGRTALITGAGGGMGLTIAGSLIRHGLNVSMADIKPPPSDIPAGPGIWMYTQCDLAREQDVKKLIETTVKKFHGINYLANTIGVLWFDRDMAAEDIALDIWDQVFRINLRATVILIKHIIPVFKEAGSGAMVHFSSIDALSGDPKPQDAYGASKAALIRLSKSLAIQYAGSQIRSNVILPGLTMTPMQDRWKNKPDIQEQVAQNIPLGRLGNPQDMADACLFLLSDHASYITGTELTVDGGVTALP